MWNFQWCYCSCIWHLLQINQVKSICFYQCHNLLFRNLIFGSQFSSTTFLLHWNFRICFWKKDKFFTCNKYLVLGKVQKKRERKRTITSAPLVQNILCKFKQKVIKGVNFHISHKFIIQQKMRLKIYFKKGWP